MYYNYKKKDQKKKANKIVLILVLAVTVILAFSSCDVFSQLETHSHKFGEWEETKTATCVEKGTLTRKCKCGETETTEIPLASHKEVTDAAVEETCTETGLSEGKHCSVCDEVIEEQHVIPVKEHTADKGVCSGCNMVMDTIVALCNYVRANGNVESGEAVMIMDYKEDVTEKGMWAVASHITEDLLVFNSTFESEGVTFTIMINVEEIASTYEVYCKVETGTESETMQILGKIVAGEVTDENCDIIDYEFAGPNGVAAEDVVVMFEDFMPNVLWLIDDLLGKQSIDVSISDFGFTEIK